MYRAVILAILISFPMISYSALDECIGVYVGRISVKREIGIDKVVFLKNPSNTSGSYWVNFAGWNSEAKKEVLSLLATAKMSQHRVDVYTTAGNQCSIGSPGQTVSEVHLSTNP